MGALEQIQAIIDAGKASAQVGRMLRGWNRNVGLTVGESVFSVQVADGNAVVCDSCALPPDISFRLSEETLDLLARRQITPLAGKLSGLIHTSGNIVDILRFASVLSASVQELSKQRQGPR